jgi:uncharacterized paraquat-inducible protein A
MTRHTKISLITSGTFLFLLFLSIFLHNFLTALTGREDKIFFLLFIFLFFLFPASLVYLIIVLIVAMVKKIKERKNKENSDFPPASKKSK